MSFMTCEEIEERMDELGRRLAETHDKKIIKELYELAVELEKIKKEVIGLKTQSLAPRSSPVICTANDPPRDRANYG
jgi:hypothetical protein